MVTVCACVPPGAAVDLWIPECAGAFPFDVSHGYWSLQVCACRYAFPYARVSICNPVCPPCDVWICAAHVDVHSRMRPHWTHAYLNAAFQEIVEATVPLDKLKSFSLQFVDFIGQARGANAS